MTKAFMIRSNISNISYGKSQTNHIQNNFKSSEKG